jgi:hypothetical protein
VRFFVRRFTEGGFKSKLNTPYANQWMTTLNGGYTIWNWIELYGDAGLLKTETKAENLYMTVESD